MISQRERTLKLALLAILTAVLLLVMPGCYPQYYDTIDMQGPTTVVVSDPAVNIQYSWADHNDVYTYSGTGTYFMLNGRCYIATAKHVLDDTGTGTIVLFDRNGARLDVRIVRTIILREQDAALLEMAGVDTVRSVKPELWTAPIPDGRAVKAVGYQGDSDSFTESRGISHGAIVASSCTLECGMSGGPLYHGNKIAGINVAYIAAIDTLEQHESLHIPISDLLHVLDSGIENK